MLSRASLFLVLLSFAGLTAKGQSLTIPSHHTFYGINPDHHMVGYSKEFSSGFGYMGLATTKAVSTATFSDKFFFGPSYTFGDQQNTTWSATVAPGIWTQGSFSDFPLYPINYGVVSSVQYILNENYSVRLGLNFNRENNFSTGTVGFTYHLGETFFPKERDTNTRKMALAFTYGGNANGHVFFLETKLSNKLGFHAITLSDELHPSKAMVDRYYIGPALFIDDEFLGPFDISMSLGLYTYGLFYNFPAYPILPGSNIKFDYNWKKHIAISAGMISLPLEEIGYGYLGFCYSI